MPKASQQNCGTSCSDGVISILPDLFLTWLDYESDQCSLILLSALVNMDVPVDNANSIGDAQSKESQKGASNEAEDITDCHSVHSDMSQE